MDGDMQVKIQMVQTHKLYNGCRRYATIKEVVSDMCPSVEKQGSGKRMIMRSQPKKDWVGRLRRDEVESKFERKWCCRLGLDGRDGVSEQRGSR